jgi:diacylglycerol kinase (ATP)
VSRANSRPSADARSDLPVCQDRILNPANPGHAGHVRVSLLYNATAGEGVPLDLIRAAIEKQGHELVCVIEKDAELERLVEEPPDLVAVAGGDGTIATAARTLAGRGIPLAILPVGTANNIAKSSGTDRSLDELIAGWATARRHPLDIGVAQGAWGRRRFIEAVGVGLIPEGINAVRKKSDGDSAPTASRIAVAVWKYARVLSRLKPVPWTIVVDGVRTTGSFLVVEALNIRSIGPNLVFSADANPSDGQLCVVMAGEEHREELGRYLQHRLVERDYTLSLMAQSGRQITLEGETEVHVDDQVLASPGPVSIHVEPGAVELLA